MTTCVGEENWEVLKRCLPEDWEGQAYQLGALKRKRKIPSAEALLRVLMLHLATGRSLRTTTAYAREAGICEINDAALLHRLKASRDWLQWMCVSLLRELSWTCPPAAEKFRVLLIDGSVVSEPGSTGTDWRLHYAFDLRGFGCEAFQITSPRTGENLDLFTFRPGDLAVADRGYCTRRGICHVSGAGGKVLVRWHSSNLPLLDVQGEPWSVLDRLRLLEEGSSGDWDVYFRHADGRGLVEGRICAIKKSREAAELARTKWLREARKKGRRVKPETLELCGYVCVFSTLDRDGLSGLEVLELYRTRWQIELIFKRLKGLVGLGHLPKINEESCKAWLYGKMLLALLAERLHREARSFSPWGYPALRPASRHQVRKQSLA
jgi:hypothetical protein